MSNRIIDDHKAFLDIGIPSADLIINFWDNSKWAFHHTISDNITYVRSDSLHATGRTVEQFIFNNYLNTSNYQYDGNYPWSEDINVFNIQMTMILVTVVIILAIAILMINVIKNDPNKFKIDLK